MNNGNTNGHTVARILLVDDNPADVKLVREALREHAVEAELKVIDDGEEAYQFVRQLRPEAPSLDLLLLDLNLPKRSGFDILRAYREAIVLNSAPVIIISSSEARRDKEEAESLGVHCYFRKPNLLDEFLELGLLVKKAVGSATR